jgi:hypothetical protein
VAITSPPKRYRDDVRSGDGRLPVSCDRKVAIRFTAAPYMMYRIATERTLNERHN